MGNSVFIYQESTGDGFVFGIGGLARPGWDPFDKGILCGLGISRKQAEILRPFGTQDDNKKGITCVKERKAEILSPRECFASQND